MATYQANITKSIEPAMANPNILQQAAASTNAAIKTLGEGAVDMYKQYVSEDIGSFTQEAREQASKFYTTNQEAQDAAEAASYMTNKVAPGIFKEAGQLATSPFPEEQAVGVDKLASFGSQLARLKAASEGGMKPEQFIANVDVITRKAISKYPGLANEIRQQVAKATGLEGADEFTQQRWISRVLNPKETKNPALEAADRDMMTFIVNRGAMSEQQSRMLRDTNPNEYYKIIEKGRDEVRQEFVLKTAKTAMEGQTVVNERDANAAWPAISANYNAGATLALQNIPTKELTELSNMLMVGIETPKFDAAALEVRAKGIINNVKGALDANLFTTKQAIREQMRRSGTTGSKIEEEQLARVDRLHKETIDMYANEKTAPYLLNILTMKEYEKYTFEQKRAVQTSAAALLSMTGNAAAVSAFFAGGSSRAQVEKSNPELFKLIDSTVNLVVGGSSMSSQEAYANMAKLQSYIAEGRKDGKSITSNTTLKPAEVKVATQLTYEQMKEYLKTVDSAKNLSSEDINVISTALTTTAKTGEKWQELGKDYTKLKESINALPDEAKDVLKLNGSNTAISVIDDLQRDKAAIEKKYNVKLQIGVTPSGKLGVIMPAPVAAQRRPMSTSEMSAALNSPAMVEQENMKKAAAAFENKAMPRMITLSSTRAIVTGQDLKAVSNDYANVINSGQPYKGYYNASPQPVAAPQQPTAAPTTPATSSVQPKTEAKTPELGTPEFDALVRASIENMRAREPSINVDYMFRAFKNASPATQKQLAEKYKAGNITMADINTK